MPAWLLTNTFYGQWLPGDDRGSITSVRDYRPDDDRHDSRIEHDKPGTDWEPPRRGLQESARRLMRTARFQCEQRHAEVLFHQFQETAAIRRRPLWAVAIMGNHLHMIVHAPDDPDPDRLLADFKSYGSRALNRQFSTNAPGRWWTEKGSKRKLPNDDAVAAAIRYVEEQLAPLLIWTHVKGRIV